VPNGFQPTGAPQPGARSSAFEGRELVRFFAFGPIGTLLGALQYEAIWRLLPAGSMRSGASWLLSSTIGIAWTHALHCRFTFRAPRGTWLGTLPGAYGIYALSIALGALLMHLLVDLEGFARTPAWIGVTMGTSLCNFGLLRRLMPAPP
jgi:putative flippase GtrA